MMYDTMSRPPRPGSLLELLFMMVQMRRELAKLMETRAIIQAVRDETASGEATQDAYTQYRKSLMPYLVQEEKDAKRRLDDALKREFEAGPMKIKPVQTNASMQSKLRKIVKSVKEAASAVPTLTWRRR